MKKTVSFILTIVLLCSLTITAFATTQNHPIPTDDNYNYIVDLAQRTSSFENKELAQDLIGKAQNAIYNATITLNIPESSYNFSDNKLAHYTDSNGNTFTALTIPVNDNNYSLLSNLTLIFDDANKLVSYSEMILTESKENTIVMQIFTDGVKTYDEVTDIDYISNADMRDWLTAVQETYTNLGDVQPYGLNVPCILAVTGAGTGVGALIVKLCGAPCVLAPPVCAVCLGGIIVVGGGSIVAAVTQCWE